MSDAPPLPVPPLPLRAALAVAGAVVFGADLVAAGGLAAVLVAALVALGLTVGVASLPLRTRVGVAHTVPPALAGWLVATAGGTLDVAGAATVAFAASQLPLTRRPQATARALLGAAAAAIVLALVWPRLGTTSSIGLSAWSALDPTWGTWRTWWSTAVVAGVWPLLPQLLRVRNAPEDVRLRDAIGTAGPLVLALVAVGIAVGWRYELGGPEGLAASLGPARALAHGLLAGGLFLLAVPSARRGVAGLEAIAWAAWFLAAGTAVAQAAAALALPVGVVVLGAVAAWRHRGRAQVQAGVLAVVAALGVVLHAPTLPTTATGAALVAATLVALVIAEGARSLASEAP